MKNGGHFAFWPGGASKQFSKILKKIPVLYIHIWHTFYPLPFEITNFDFLAPLYYGYDIRHDQDSNSQPVPSRILYIDHSDGLL